METIKKSEFDKKYGQGHLVLFKKDIKAFSDDISKSIKANPGFKNDILQKAKAQLINLQPMEVEDEFGEKSQVYVMKMSQYGDMETFIAHRKIVTKALQDGLIDENKADELIIKAKNKYQVGDISSATGLEKQPDGSWAPPKGGGKSSPSDDESGEKRSSEKEDSKYENADEGDKKEILESLSESERGKLKDYLKSLDESEVNKFKEDVKNGTLHRDTAIAKLRLIGMDESKANKLVEKMIPAPQNLDEFAAMVKDGRVPEEKAVSFMVDMGFDEETAREKVSNARMQSAVVSAVENEGEEEDQPSESNDQPSEESEDTKTGDQPNEGSEESTPAPDKSSEKENTQETDTSNPSSEPGEDDFEGKVSDEIVQQVQQWVGDEYGSAEINSIVEAYNESGFDLMEDAAKIGDYKNQYEQSERVNETVDALFSEIMPNNWHQNLDERAVKDILWGLVMTATS